jgi:hypothetical protein
MIGFDDRQSRDVEAEFRRHISDGCRRPHHDGVPCRAAAHVTSSVAEPGLARLNCRTTDQAAFVGIIDQFEVMIIAMLIVSPLVLFLRKPRPAN